MNGGQIKETLKDGGAVFGFMISASRNGKWAVTLGGGGIDYTIIDTEHAQRSREELADLVLILKAYNVSPIIRIPYPVPHYVAMALDAGADGVLVPYCEDPQVVRDCVAVKNWHPMKGRSVFVESPIEEEAVFVAAAFDAFQKLLGDDLVRVDVLTIQRCDHAVEV